MKTQTPFPQEAWDKLRTLLDAAKANPTLSTQLRTSSPAEVRDILRAQFHLSADDVTDLVSQFENIADRNSLQWWSPLK
jgi:hypothetical protein